MINVIASMVDTLVGRESSSIPLLHHLDHAVAVYMDPNMYRPLYINVTCMDDIHADWGSLST